MSDRLALFKRISDYLFASYRWGCMNSPGVLAPKPLGLSIDLLEYQRLNQPNYAAYCEICGRTARGMSILDYPPIPVDCFQCADMSLFSKDSCIAEFHSRINDDGQTIHRFCDLGLLQRSLIYAFTLMIARTMSPMTRVFSLLPPRHDDMHSQTSFMAASFVETFGAPDSAHFGSADDGLDTTRLIKALEKASLDNAPVHIIGSPALYSTLLDAMGERSIAGAQGSCIMLTSALTHEMCRCSLDELRKSLSQKLGIDQRHIYCVFEMSELSSQGYEICAMNCTCSDIEDGLYIFPNWVKCMIFNPESMSPLLPGNPGRIAVFDLCSLDSVAFVLTQYEGELVTLTESLRSRVQGHPKYALKLHGKASESIPEGCRSQWKMWAERIVV